MALILPKGIVINSPETIQEVERINTEPLDPADIARFWKVYTTTKRRLLDPTAERLENFWWRIWGSRRRELNGAVVARLFAYISDGQSFVPLRGPANRDEGTTPPNKSTCLGTGIASATTLNRPSKSRPSTTSSTVSKGGILKKGPSLSTTTSTRTARFISPHDSEAEANTKSSTGSISPNSHVVVQPPSPDAQNLNKKTVVTGGSKKKGQFVASTAAKKKRPVITRRQSSHSSTENAPKIERAGTQPSSERTPPTFSEISRGKRASRLQENISPDHLVAQSPRKRPSSKKQSRKGKEILNTSELPNEHGEDAEAGPSSMLRSSQTQQAVSNDEELTEEELDELELQHTLLKEANARDKTGSRPLASAQPLEDLRVPQKSIRASPVHEPSQQDLGAIRMLPHDAKSAPKVAVASAEAIGELGLNDPITPLPQVTGAKGRDKGKGRDLDEFRQADLFAKSPVPPILSTEIAPIPVVDSLVRSKSQLTLLLEKDRVRSTDKKRNSKKE